jgi:hypothetical protein
VPHFSRFLREVGLLSFYPCPFWASFLGVFSWNSTGSNRFPNGATATRNVVSPCAPSYDRGFLHTDFPCLTYAVSALLPEAGHAPGLNAVIRAATKAAILKRKWKVIGIPDGFDRLIWPEKSFELTLDRVSGILPRRGTILGTTNRGNPFHYKTEENGQEVVRDISDEIHR